MADSLLQTPPVDTPGAPAPAPRGVRWARLWWPALVAGMIFLGSSRSRVIATGITRVDDKFAHFAVYGLLATLVCRAGHGWRAAVVAVVVASAFGASDEWHQSFVPGRFSDVGDWLADTLGAALAVALYVGWSWYRRLLETPLHRAPGQAADRRKTSTSGAADR